MGEVRFTMRSVLKDRVRPAIEAFPGGLLAVVALDALVNTLDGLPAADGKKILDTEIAFPTPDLPSLPVGSGGSAPAMPQPIDPQKVLQAIAEAIEDAEEILGRQRLAIATGHVEADMTVNIGGVAGASAKFRLQIGPTPTT